MSKLAFTALGLALPFAMTALGAAVVFFFRKSISQKMNGVILGFSSGIMIAASVWSMLLPAIDGAGGSFIPAAAGFLLGGAFLYVLGKVLGAAGHGGGAKLFFAITLHNVPEGLAVGFAFGAAASGGARGGFLGALGLAIGIAVQNFPEGAAVSLPLRGLGRRRAFLLGAASGAVEPVAAVAGYFLAARLLSVQPWLLGFAAGAMVAVSEGDLVPEAAASHPSFGTWGFLLGFAGMMILDVALG